MLSSTFIRLIGVSTLTNSTTYQRAAGFPPQSSYHRIDQTHYQHGIPGIPTDGKVVLLKNSNTGSQVYLVGTCHVSKESPQLVKKVINSVKPDVVAIEQTNIEFEGRKSLKPVTVNVDEGWFRMFLRSVRSPGGLQHKINELRINIKERQLQADGIIRGEEFEVAIEECLKLKAKLVPIDREVGYFHIEIPWKVSFQRYMALRKEPSKEHLMEEGSRSYVRESTRVGRIHCPELYQLLIENRDKHMFTMLRRMEERLIVAVVGLGHMDGIELLWLRAEEAEDDKFLLAASENGRHQTGDVAVEKMERRI
ncbi:hypothetical protein MKW94_013560 [Papaver nudicaule]|uniref:TraB domain-containing protein n=1 Tax=Papaver nudicaule TaxID=74823 RepID=A0AA41SAJ3_PAPNU|nr:hypothetical protein [Papaver nudicaule]